MRGNKHVDPALCLYYGAKFICVMDNKALDEDVPRGNGMMCRFKSIKLKTDATSVRTKLFHGRKVTTVNARDIEYMECEVIDNSSHIKDMSRRLQHLNKKKKKHKQEIKQLKQQIKTARNNKTFQLKTSTTVRCSINPSTPLMKFKLS
jgi:predicted RNase H-like nuclease (RuvC/YqgF family)